jgi:hypothetical protein
MELVDIGLAKASTFFCFFEDDADGLLSAFHLFLLLALVRSSCRLTMPSAVPRGGVLSLEQEELVLLVE